MQKIKKIYKFILKEKRMLTYSEILRGLNIKKQKMPLPSFVQIEPTTRCNLNCVMCTRSKMNRNRLNHDLSFEQFKKILQEIPSVRTIKLQGMGEPLLNENLFAMTEYGRKKGIRFVTTINGTLINANNIDLILKNFQEITISLDVANSKDYLNIRRADCFEVVKKNIRLLIQRREELKSKNKIAINSVISHLNYKEIPKIIELAKECGIDAIGFVEVENWKTPLEQDYQSELNFIQQARKLSKEIERLILEAKKQNSLEINYFVVNKRKENCLWPFYYCFITVDGFITPCCIRMDPDVINFGNIFQESFEKIWNGEKYQNFRKTIIKNLANQICDNCPD